MGEHLPSLLKALGSILNTEKKKHLFPVTTVSPKGASWMKSKGSIRKKYWGWQFLFHPVSKFMVQLCLSEKIEKWLFFFFVETYKMKTDFFLTEGKSVLTACFAN
jgi:hypothetical protein